MCQYDRSWLRKGVPPFHEKVAKGLEVKPVELFRFSSDKIPVSESDKMVLELVELLQGNDNRTLGHVLSIVREALELEDQK